MLLCSKLAMSGAECTASYESSEDPSQARVSRGPYLVALFNCSRPFDPPARISIGTAERVELGRGDQRSVSRNVIDEKRVCQIRVADETVSALHAFVARDADGTFRLWDCGSKNGTTLNGTRVEEPVRLVDRDLVATGCSFFLFRSTQDGCVDEPVDVETDSSPLTTANPAFGRALAKGRSVAATELPVLVVGPASSGRRTAARWLHEASGRTGSFVRLVGTAFLDQLVTLRKARGGSVYIEELEGLSQQAGEVLSSLLDPRDWGHESEPGEPLNIRFLASCLPETRDSLAPKLASRLGAHVLEIPPLAARPEDVGLLIAQALREAGAPANVRLERPAARALLSYDWPGNLEELFGAVRHAVAFARNAPIDRQHLPESLRQHERTGRARRNLIALLELHRGNVTAVARALSVSRMQVHRLARLHSIDISDYRPPVHHP